MYEVCFQPVCVCVCWVAVRGTLVNYGALVHLETETMCPGGKQSMFGLLVQATPPEMKIKWMWNVHVSVCVCVCVCVCLTGSLPRALGSGLSAAAPSDLQSASPWPPFAPWSHRTRSSECVVQTQTLAGACVFLLRLFVGAWTIFTRASRLTAQE